MKIRRGYGCKETFDHIFVMKKKCPPGKDEGNLKLNQQAGKEENEKKKE